MTTNSYRDSWDGYWASLSGAKDEVFWDSDPMHASALDVDNLAPFFDAALPLVDFGCGNGTQTRFLASRFPKVIGVDVSSAAIQAARKSNSMPNPEFRVADILDSADASALHAEIGDANVYVRAVLHQLDPAEQGAAARALHTLIGSRGTLYLLELSSAAEPYLHSLVQQYGPPPQFARVMQHNIRPGKLNENELEPLFPQAQFETLAAGTSCIQTVHVLPTGEPARVRAFYRIIRRRS